MNFVHMRPRSQFGKQCLFSHRGPEILDSIPPNKRDFEAFILKDPVHTGTQVSSTFAEHVVNTSSAKIQNTSMNHTEGGWPKDVNINDADMTGRFRRKTEKEEVFIRVVNGLCKKLERTILQNNAINIYDNYFEECEPSQPVEECRTRQLSMYRDQEVIKRPVSYMSWSPDHGTKLAVSYCHTIYQYPRHNISKNCYIWDINNQMVPLMVLSPDIPMVILEYTQKDPNLLAGGMMTGQTTHWDARAGASAVAISPKENSHRDPVSELIWINSKSGMEFFTSSTDGTVKWWDIRKLETPTESLVIDVVKPDEQDRGRALGVSALEYEPTIPTRFIMGSDMGMIIGGNRKGKLPSEKILYRINAANGPIYKIQRNPAFPKNFLVISGFQAAVWCEDAKESAIIFTPPGQYQLLDGAWSPTKLSTFFVTRSDGTIDIWNIINTQKQPTISVKVSTKPIRKIRFHESGGKLVLGNNGGTMYLLEVSNNLVTNQKNDKALLSAMFEREARREKILEGRIREIKLKVKTDNERLQEEAERRAADSRMEGRSEDSIQPLTTVESATDSRIAEADAEFWKILEKERANRAPKKRSEELEEEKEEEKEEGEEEEENDDEGEEEENDDEGEEYEN